MKIAFILSGQGAQIPGMMKDLADQYESSKQVFQTADNALERSISGLCFNGTEEELALTHNTQPCVLAADLAAAEALKAEGIMPDVVAGFSLGEYGALILSEVMDISDAFRVVQIRADSMQEAVPIGKGAMAAMMGVSDEQIVALCDEVEEYVVPANFNSPVQTVISGTSVGVDKALELAESKGIKGIKLAVSAPFHCELMEPAAERIRTEFQNMSFNNPSIPVYMNATSKVLESGEAAKDLLYRQAMSAVLWKQTLINMLNDGVDTFIECGPGKTLWGLVRKTLPKGTTILRVADRESLTKTLSSLRSE